MSRVVLATGNAGKVRELAALLADSGMEIVPQTELGVDDADETGLTFIENALIKARHASAVTGLPAIADDSGLAVDALGGAPGIHSARYAGLPGDDAANNAKLLDALDGLPEAGRGAQFHCVMVYLRHAADPVPVVCHGRWPGQILAQPRGDNGFGYDPLFLVPETGCASAELAPDVKNRLSHRGRALRQLVEQIRAGAGH